MFYLNKKEYDYAIRICAFLAGRKINEPISVTKLSKLLLITKPFATKIIYNLRSFKIIDSKQGKFGGIYLNADPEKLTLYNILESVGLCPSISSCIKKDDFCPLPAPCKQHSYFMDLENYLIKELKSKTISQFAFSENDLK